MEFSLLFLTSLPFFPRPRNVLSEVSGGQLSPGRDGPVFPAKEHDINQFNHRITQKQLITASRRGVHVKNFANLREWCQHVSALRFQYITAATHTAVTAMNFNSVKTGAFVIRLVC